MATGLESRKGSNVEALIDRQIADTCRRIRLFDAGASLLLLGSSLFAYALTFAIFDLATQGSHAAWIAAVRWTAYLIFLGLAALLGIQLLQRVARRVNPYYAARRLEETVPDAKNSVINWLDLREQSLPPVLRKSLGNKAAGDLRDADPEHAIDRKPTWLRLGVFTALVLGMLVLLGVRPGQFFSLMQRAFLPFYHGQLSSETRITVLRPEAGDATVTEKQPVAFSVQIDGRVPAVNQPGGPALLYRYQHGDKFVAQPLQQDDNGRWFTRMLPDQVGSTGFWYKITAGDATTPVYQVSVRAQPLVLRYEITYKYRPYLHLPVETVAFPNQQAALPFVQRHRGTEVALVVRTNRTLQEGGVKLVTGKLKKDLRTEVLKDDPQAFRCQWTLEQSGEFFVSFISSERETYVSRIPFSMDVLVDATPTVVLTHPKQNVEMPANGTLAVQGLADDDLGLKALTLRLERVEAGKAVALKPLAYRPEVFRDLDGKEACPVHLDYLDNIKLDELRTVGGQLARLQVGSLVRYWLEATDNSDYPTKTGNVGKSLPYEIKIQPPQDEDQQRKTRDQAEKKQQQHNARQDQKLSQDKKDKEDRDARNNGESGDGGDKGAQEKADQFKKDVKNDLDKLDKKPSSAEKGEAKGEQPNHSESKSGDNGGAGAPNAEQKDQKPSDANQPGDSKGAEPPAGADQKPGQSKDAGGNEKGGGDNQPGDQPQADPMKGTKKDASKDSGGEGKGDGPQPGGPEQPAKAKTGGPDPKTPNQSPQAKSGAESGQDAPSAQSKPGDGGSQPPPPSNQPPQGVAKADEAMGPPSLSKGKGESNGKQNLDPRLKADAEKEKGEVVGAGKSDTKPPTNDQAKEAAGVAKDDGQRLKDADTRKPTPEDVAHLKELMKREDGVGDLAAKALTEMTKEAPDPAVRKLAQEALDQSGRKMGPGDDPKAPINPKGPPGKASPDDAKTAEATGNGGQKKEASAPPSDDGKGDPARKDLSRFAGNLQLEDFIKRATPEYRAKAGITPEEWQRLLTKAAEYDKLLRTMQKQAKGKTLAARGTSGTLGSSGPAAVQGSQAVGDPQAGGQAQTPPELLDAQRRFKDR
jgi:collagen type III alpha